MAFLTSTIKQKRVRLCEDDSPCEACGKHDCHLVLDYEIKGIPLGSRLFSRIIYRSYFVTCDACNREWSVPLQERYLAYEQQAIPWYERVGFNFYILCCCIIFFLLACVVIVATLDVPVAMSASLIILCLLYLVVVLRAAK